MKVVFHLLEPFLKKESKVYVVNSAQITFFLHILYKIEIREREVQEEEGVGRQGGGERGKSERERARVRRGREGCRGL